MEILVEPNRVDKLPGTVVITHLAERRARDRSAPIPDETPANDALPPGTRLGRYLIVERLGGGGMGVVYKAQDTELHRTVALKVLPPHLCRQPDYLSRFRAEAQAQARLNNPFVTQLYSLLELPAGEVLVLEYSEGQTLEQRLKSGGPLPPAEAVRIFDQALRAVEHIHDVGIVHRDLKPGNIFLTRDGRVKLMDFGVAKIMDQPDLSTQRTMVGTLLYIAPEQINGHTTDFRSDVYTLGVSLFEAVTGRLPFERRSDYALMHAHVQERPPSPKDFQRSIPPALEGVILKAIEKDPERRFQSVAEFRKTLIKLGLVERRDRDSARQTGNHDESESKQNESLSDRPAARRLLGGLWLDAALIAAAVVLVYTLGLDPLKPPVNGTRAALTGGVANASTLKSPSVTRGRASSSVNPAPTIPIPADKYGALREAWSD